MIKAFTAGGTAILSLDYVESDGAMFCPECRRELLFKSGEVRIPHFAHYPEDECTHNDTESYTHLYCKLQMWRALRKDPDCSFCEYEVAIGNRRPDILSTISGHQVAIEIQNSDTTIADLRQKL